MRFCQDCKHYAGIYYDKGHSCGHPTAEKHPIHGAPYESAIWSRGDGRCGHDAVLFEAKPEERKKVSWLKRVWRGQ
jgi:hypothetical protein